MTTNINALLNDLRQQVRVASETAPYAEVQDSVSSLDWKTLCPHCGGMDTIEELDWDTRRNTLETCAFEDGGLGASIYVDGDTNYEHLAYFCSKCGNIVRIPEDIEVDYT